jgi:hypothetical protein
LIHGWCIWERVLFMAQWTLGKLMARVHSH